MDVQTPETPGFLSLRLDVYPDFLTAPPVVQKHQSVGASRHPRRRRTIARQRDQLGPIFFAEKAAPNHLPSRIRQKTKCKKFFRVFNESGYSSSRSGVNIALPNEHARADQG